MTPRPTPSTPPAPARRMLARPPTLDVVGGLERFRCLDIMGGTLLSRASCAARWRSETSRASGAARQGAADGPMPHMPCVGCPVGKLHADEQRAGTVPRLAVVQGRHATSQARRPAPAHVEAPAAVVPAKRASSRPAAVEPTTQTPGPLRADAQQAVDAGNPVGAGDRSEPHERTSPAEIADPPLSPPSGSEVSAGRRTRAGFPGRLLRHPTTGEEMLGVEWAKKLGISHQLISWRLAKGRPMEQVLAPCRHPAISAGVKAAKARGPAATPTPSGEPTVTCCDCGAVVARTSNRQRRCPDCRKRLDLASSRDAKREARRQAGVPERRGPVQAPARPPTGVGPSPTPGAPERRVEVPAAPSPALDWIDRHYALAGLAVRVALTSDALRRATDEATEARRAYRDALRALAAQGVP